MIADVLIRNFKCFKSLIVPELGRITLISGRNNVGKTALLEALFLFFDRMRADMILRQFAQRGIEKVLLEPQAMWGPIFNNYIIEQQEILISVTLNKTTESARFWFNSVFQPFPPTNIPSPKQKREISTEEKSATFFALDIEYCSKDDSQQFSHLYIDSQGRPALHIDYMKSKPQSASFFVAKKHISSQEVAEQFSILAKEGRENEAVEFLKMIEPRLETLKVIKEGPTSSVQGKLEGLPRTVHINFMGEGMEKLLSLIVAIVHSPNRIIFLDEMENGLHYSIMPKIWEALGKALRKYNCQLITTTHSYECLQAAYEGLSEMPEDFRYIRLHRKRKGEDVSAKLSNYDMIGTAIRTNLELR